MSNNENNRKSLSAIRGWKLFCNILGFSIGGISVVAFVASLVTELVRITWFLKNLEAFRPVLYVTMAVSAVLALVVFIARYMIIAALSRREIKLISENSVDVKDNDALLKVNNLSLHFGPLKAVDNVSFDVKKGEVFGLVGESGCGKTTTGRTIIRLYDATGGEVYFKGQRICAGSLGYKKAIADAKASAEAEIAALKADSKAHKENETANNQKIAQVNANLNAIIKENKTKIKEANLIAKYVDRKLVTKIQMIFQDPIASLDPRMTVRDIIAEGLVINGMTDKKLINEKVYEILEKVGLVREHADRYPHEFSGGQRQRIGIARAVVMQPEMIIADEPVSALDVSVQAQVINLLNDLKESMGLTILFIAHDLSVVKYFSDRIGVMYFGKMVELADADELFKNPMHPYTKSLLSAIPLPDPIYEKKRTRITYNPLADHDYSVNSPTLREISPGHFVLCNDEEEAKYKEMLK